MGRESIGEFEQLVLLAILRLGEDAYGLPVVDEIARESGRKVLAPAAYVALRRLEDKGLVSGERRATTPKRSGRPRRYYRVTPAGLARLRDSRRTLLRMWSGLQTLLED